MIISLKDFYYLKTTKSLKEDFSEDLSWKEEEEDLWIGLTKLRPM